MLKEQIAKQSRDWRFGATKDGTLFPFEQEDDFVRKECYYLADQILALVREHYQQEIDKVRKENPYKKERGLLYGGKGEGFEEACEAIKKQLGVTNGK